MVYGTFRPARAQACSAPPSQIHPRSSSLSFDAAPLLRLPLPARRRALGADRRALVRRARERAGQSGAGAGAARGVRAIRRARARPARHGRVDVDAARRHRRRARRDGRGAGRFLPRLVPRPARLHRSGDQLLPRLAADRADPPGDRLLRHRRAGQDGDPVLRLVLRRRDRDVRRHRPDQPDLRARLARRWAPTTSRSSPG